MTHMALSKIDEEYVLERIKNEFWIDRYGACHYYTGTLEDAYQVTSFHFNIARNLYPTVKYPDDVLTRLGWIAVGSGSYKPEICKSPTDSQCRTMRKLGHCSITLYNGTELML